MGDLKGKAFWIVLGVFAAIILAAYALPVRKMEARNKERIDELQGGKSALDGMRGNAANAGMIEAASLQKSNLQKEYGRMLLYLVGKDELLDHYDPAAKIPPQRILSLDQKETVLLRDLVKETKEQLSKDIAAKGILFDPQSSPWDIINLDGALPRPARLVYAYKQLWVQKTLAGVMTQPTVEKERPVVKAEPAAARSTADEPAEAGDEPPAEAAPESRRESAEMPRGKAVIYVLDKVQFKTPAANEKFDPRFVVYSFSVKVALTPANVPAFIEGILKSELPFEIISYSVTKLASETMPSQVTARIDPKDRLVSMKVDCRVLDFSVGVQKVVFSKERFPEQKDIDEWLQAQVGKDELMTVLKMQMEKEKVSPVEQKDDQASYVSYVVYGANASDLATYQVDDGVTIHFGCLEQSVPKVGER